MKSTRSISPVRPPLAFLASLFLLLTLSLQVHGSPNRQAVNPVIGDLSFLAAYGEAPTSNTDSELRTATHLAFAEALLRQVDVRHLSPTLQARRSFLLDLLHKYWTEGIFPHNYDHAGERRPCFIDKDGRICAVGYLVEQTAGCSVAEAINAKYQYADLLDMQDPALEAWIAGSGLSKLECAIIQPTYGTPVSGGYDVVTPAQGIASATFIGLNAGIGGVNTLNLIKGKPGIALPIIGIAGGVAQATMGALQFPEARYDYWSETWLVNRDLQRLSMINIGMGTANACLGVISLVQRKARQEQPRVGYNLFSAPTGNGAMAYGLGLTTRF